ncbi:glycosyltransferase family 2 protein [Parvibaculum sedimenti]|nr:glycosyltransferase family 2 protein [Parvibaculum sedimenti]
MRVETADHWERNINVIIVTFNSAAVVRDAVRSLPRGMNVIVVDNASADQSVLVAGAEGARCITCDSNIGFGRASNLGAARSSAEFILFLNPDAVLGEHALEAMYRAAMRFPDAAIVGPRLIDGEGRTCLRYSSILHPLSDDALNAPCEPEGVCCMPLLTGAALLCRRSAFEQVGGFDENIFLYYEDDDLCLRLRRAGWSLLYEPEAEVFHGSGRSSPQTSAIARFKSAQRLLSRFYIAKKYALPFEPGYERRKALKRLAISVVKCDRLRFASALGRLGALAQLNDGATGQTPAQCFNSGRAQSSRHHAAGNPALTPTAELDRLI